MPFNEGPFSSVVLRVTGPERDSQPIPLEIPGRYLIGSEANAVVRLPLATNVSPRHAILLLEPTSLRIRDLDSSSGTYLNRQKIVAAELKDGDLIRCGTFTIKVSLLQHAPLTQTVIPAAATLASEAAEHDMPPVINGYAELVCIGRGSLGSVYRARQLVFASRCCEDLATPMQNQQSSDVLSGCQVPQGRRMFPQVPEPSADRFL